MEKSHNNLKNKVPFFAPWSSWQVAGNYLNLDGHDGHGAEGGTFLFSWRT